MPRILVIEDDPSMRLLLNRVLGRAGYDVVECDTGTTGLAAALAESFDFRVRLPDQRGWSGPSATRSAKPASIKLDVNHRAFIAGDKRTALSQREFLLLAYLLEHKGEVCSRPELLDRVWDLAFDPGTNVVDVYVRRLRVKLGEIRIETIRNVGYRLVA